MKKNYRLYVTNIDQALSVLKDLDITASSNGTGIAFAISEAQKMDVVIRLNKEKIVVYDIEEVI